MGSKYSKEDIKNYIKNLKNYQGYIQYSNRAISKEDDIFLKDAPKVDEKGGFIYEAHFCDGKKSISIKQINDGWIVTETDISTIKEDDIQSYISDIKNFNYSVKMAQVWEEKVDEFCEKLKTKNLKNIVFAGFEKGESK